MSLIETLDDLSTALGAIGQVKARLERVNAELAARGYAPLLTAAYATGLTNLAARVTVYRDKCQNMIVQAPEVDG